MEPIKLECTYEERKSKAGTYYKCLVVKLSPTYSKVILLDVPEQCLVETTNCSTIKPNEMPL